MCYSRVVFPNLFHSEESFENLKNISEALKVPQGDQSQSWLGKQRQGQ